MHPKVLSPTDNLSFSWVSKVQLSRQAHLPISTFIIIFLTVWIQRCFWPQGQALGIVVDHTGTCIQGDEGIPSVHTQPGTELR